MSENKNSVRLSAMNVDIRSKLSKFDTTNEGELNMEDMMHAIVTLQKQSNNYKRLLYIILPIMVIMIASIFGTTILAINLTKDIKTNSDGLLVNANSGNVVSTSQAMKYNLFNEWLNSGDQNALREIHALELENMILPVQSVFVNTKNNDTTIITEFMYININFSSLTFDIVPKKSYQDDLYVQEMIQSFKDQVNTYKSKFHIESKFNIFELFGFFTVQQAPKPAAASKPICAPNGICNSPPKPKVL